MFFVSLNDVILAGTVGKSSCVSLPVSCEFSYSYIQLLTSPYFMINHRENSHFSMSWYSTKIMFIDQSHSVANLVANRRG